MKIIKKTDEKLIFSLKMNESLANSIRRSVSLIPTMAVDVVEIARNDSALYDETLAHRIGLVPLKFNKSFKKDSVLKIKLNAKKEGTVYSGEIKGNCAVVDENIPLTILGENQEIKIKGTTKMGMGKDHAKFSPGLLFYRNISKITMDKEFEGEIKKTFPENEINVKGSKIVVEDDKEKSLLDFCEGLAEKQKKKIEIEEGDRLMFAVESFGQIKAEEVFKKAVEILKKELKAIKIK